MSLDAFRKALDDLADPAYCEGTARLTEALAIALPDGDVGAAADKTFVDWLVEHAEPAPFGAGGKTKVDKTVRDALRLVARGRADVVGFEPSAILDEIEAVLSPGEHLDAKLTDVLVYRKGGQFKRHKDTPRDPDLVGTLVVGLPIEHAGGEFHIANGDDHVVDWSGKPDPATVRWLAMFSDADHEVQPVTSGTRVTLTYSLSRSGRPRESAERAARMKKLATLAKRLPMPERGPLLIACSRHVITDDKLAVQEIDVLRGVDREIADAIVEQGYAVGVRSCVTAVDADNDGGLDDDDDDGGGARLQADRVYTIARLSQPITKKAIAKLDDYCCTFAESASYEGEEMPASTLAPYILDSIPRSQWVIRKSAAGTLIHEAEMFSEDGYFGNEGYEAHIYTLAALEVTRRKSKAKAPAKPPTKTKTKTKTKAKK